MVKLVVLIELFTQADAFSAVPSQFRRIGASAVLATREDSRRRRWIPTNTSISHTAIPHKQFTMRPTQILRSGGGPEVGKYGW